MAYYTQKLIFIVTTYFATLGKGEDLSVCPPSVPRSQRLKVFGYSCLEFVHSEVSWSSARSYCRHHGGDLATLDDLDHQNFVVETLRNDLHWDKKGVWIGGTDSDHEGRWVWIGTGKQMQFDNWASGQGPHRSKGFLFSSLIGKGEDCALMRLEDGGRWHDYPCSGGPAFHYTYICQYKAINNQHTTSTTPVHEVVVHSTVAPDTSSKSPTSTTPTNTFPSVSIAVDTIGPTLNIRSTNTPTTSTMSTTTTTTSTTTTSTTTTTTTITTTTTTPIPTTETTTTEEPTTPTVTMTSPEATSTTAGHGHGHVQHSTTAKVHGHGSGHGHGTTVATR